MFQSHIITLSNRHHEVWEPKLKIESRFEKKSFGDHESRFVCGSCRELHANFDVCEENPHQLLAVQTQLHC